MYLVTGNDLPKVERTLDRLRGRFDAGSVERLVAGKGGASGADVVAACNAGTLLDGERLVLVTHVDGQRGEYDRLSGGWKAEDVEAVVAYLSDPAPGTVLCLVGAEVKKDSPLGKACAKAGDVLAWEIGKRDAVAWIGKSFAERGVKVGGDACRTLLDLVGDDKLVLAREIDKLATWAAGEPLGIEEVQRLATASAEAWNNAASSPFTVRGGARNSSTSVLSTVDKAATSRSVRRTVSRVRYWVTPSHVKNVGSWRFSPAVTSPSVSDVRSKSIGA